MMFRAGGRAQEVRRAHLFSQNKLLHKERLNPTRKDFISVPGEAWGSVVLGLSASAEAVLKHMLQMPLCKLSFFSSFPTGFGLPVCTWTAL